MKRREVTNMSWTLNRAVHRVSTGDTSRGRHLPLKPSLAFAESLIAVPDCTDREAKAYRVRRGLRRVRHGSTAEHMFCTHIVSLLEQYLFMAKDENSLKVSYHSRVTTKTFMFPCWGGWSERTSLILSNCDSVLPNVRHFLELGFELFLPALPLRFT